MPQITAPKNASYRGEFLDQVNDLVKYYHGTQESFDINSAGRINITASPSSTTTDGAVIKVGSSACGVCSAIASSAACQSLHREIYGLGHEGAYGLYVRGYVSAAVSADTARIFTTVNSCGAGTARGLHVSLSHAACGALSGLGTAIESTIHLPATAVTGTLSALKVAVNSDSCASDPAGSTLSMINVVNQGDTCGKADVDTDAFLFKFCGFSVGSGKMVDSSASCATGDGTIKICIGGTTKYLLYADNHC